MDSPQRQRGERDLDRDLFIDRRCKRRDDRLAQDRLRDTALLRCECDVDSSSEHRGDDGGLEELRPNPAASRVSEVDDGRAERLERRRNPQEERLRPATERVGKLDCRAVVRLSGGVDYRRREEARVGRDPRRLSELGSSPPLGSRNRVDDSRVGEP